MGGSTSSEDQIGVNFLSVLAFQGKNIFFFKCAQNVLKRREMKKNIYLLRKFYLFYLFIFFEHFPKGQVAFMHGKEGPVIGALMP